MRAQKRTWTRMSRYALIRATALATAWNTRAAGNRRRQVLMPWGAKAAEARSAKAGAPTICLVRYLLCT